MIILDTGGGSEFDNDGKGRGNIPTNGETAGETAAFERAFELGITDFPEDLVAAGVGGGFGHRMWCQLSCRLYPIFSGIFSNSRSTRRSTIYPFLGGNILLSIFAFYTLGGFLRPVLGHNEINIAQFTSVEKTNSTKI